MAVAMWGNHHTVSAPKEQKETEVGSQQTSSLSLAIRPAHGMLLLIFSVTLCSFAKSSGKYPYRKTQGCVSMVTSNPIRLTMTINGHNLLPTKSGRRLQARSLLVCVLIRKFAWRKVGFELHLACWQNSLSYKDRTVALNSLLGSWRYLESLPPWLPLPTLCWTSSVCLFCLAGMGVGGLSPLSVKIILCDRE